MASASTRLGDKRADDRARGFDVSDETCALTSDDEECIFIAGCDGLVEFGEYWRRIELDLVCSRFPALDELGA